MCCIVRFAARRFILNLPLLMSCVAPRRPARLPRPRAPTRRLATSRRPGPAPERLVPLSVAHAPLHGGSPLPGDRALPGGLRPPRRPYPLVGPARALLAPARLPAGPRCAPTVARTSPRTRP
jgi:hypothetical protein